MLLFIYHFFLFDYHEFNLTYSTQLVKNNDNKGIDKKKRTNTKKIKMRIKSNHAYAGIKKSNITVHKTKKWDLIESK